MSDIFDQLAGSQQPTPAPPPQPAQPSQASGQGDVFDQLASGQNVTSTQGMGTGDTSPLHIDPSDNPALKTGKGLGAIGAGIGDGLLHTLNGGADFLHLPHATLQSRQNELEHDNTKNPNLNAIGYGGETLAEFLSGDEALKGLALSARLFKTAKIAEALEGSPRIMQALKIGAGALRSGAVQGTLGTIRSGGDFKTGAEEGASTAALAGALGAIPMAVKAIKTALDPAAIQKPLQDSVRAVMSSVADHANLNGPTSASIRDVVDDVSKQVRSSASDLYQKIDNISGGQAQRFRDAAENVANKLREITGLDDEKEAELTAQQQKIADAHSAMLDKLEAAGHPRDLLQQADALWKKQGALSDLSNSLRQSVTGMRPELAAAGGKSTPEAVNPKTLFVKLNRLQNSGRLAQAIGPGHAEQLLQAVDAAYVQGQKIAANNRWAGMLGKAAASVGLGGAGYGAVKLAHELLGQ